jgi:hypothetical protein
MAEIQQYDQRTHVLERPSYIGPVDKSDRTVWVLDEESKTMVKRDISFSSALMKIVDGSVNALDRVAHNTLKSSHNVRSTHRCRRLISIMNDGDGISSAVHAATQIYTPQLLFWSTPDFFQL